MTDKEMAFIAVNKYKTEYSNLSKDISKYSEGLENMKKHKKKLLTKSKKSRQNSYIGIALGIAFLSSSILVGTVGMVPLSVILAIASGANFISTVVSRYNLKESRNLMATLEESIVDIDAHIDQLSKNQEFVMSQIDYLTDIAYSDYQCLTNSDEIIKLRNIIDAQEEYRSNTTFPDDNFPAKKVMDMSNEAIDPIKYGHGYDNFPPLEL